jgi:hypothetical protein
MDAIDNLNISDKSKTIYKNALQKHLKGVDYKDYDLVVKTLEKIPQATRIVVIKALHHITKDERYATLHQDQSDRYKSSLIDKAVENPIDINWNTKIKEARWRHTTNPHSQEDFAMYLWVLLMYHHPRRFMDYHLLDITSSPDKNYYDRKNHIMVFNVFKTVKLKTGGDKVVTLNKEVAEELDRYIDTFNIKGLLFPVNERRIRYLMKKYDIPLCNQNRKYQETKDIADGKSHYETAKKFNHSLGTHFISYVTPPNPHH